MIKIKLFFLFFFLFFSINAKCLDYGYILNAENGSHNTLYITKPESIDSVRTVTYYLSKDKPDNVLFDAFLIFSEEIGLSSAGVFLPLTDRADELLQEKGISQSNFYLFQKKSSCNFSRSKKEQVIFEIVESKRCFYFIADDPSWLGRTLGLISENIRNTKHGHLQNITEEEILNSLKEGIDFDNFKNKENVNILHEFLKGIIDYRY